MDPREFNLTRHSLERLRERHPLVSAEIKKQAGDKGTAIVIKLTYEFFHGSTEERAFLNDHNFMIMLHEKYGHRDYRVFIRDNVMFIGVVEENRNTIVTVLDRRTHKCNHLRTKQKKFKSKE